MDKTGLDDEELEPITFKHCALGNHPVVSTAPGQKVFLDKDGEEVQVYACQRCITALQRQETLYG